MNYKIKKISEINIDHLRQFYALAFPSRYKTLSKHWKWCYKIGHSNFEPLVVEYNSKINFQQIISFLYFSIIITLIIQIQISII